ncbi:adenylate kinase [Salana multivorans]|mgnify:CR=1 FL=1|uniref:Adenylate kinase n=1 Tax=Salana multivorans TaxID=120377 RepID=A0A3N2DC54_9MICO|nr:adenylate kinase [Salana multivorans]MBN8883438.1 adenylate kinase [Salana multivorans]OJX97770.1 MAG: adenylate kinase [Micrococcales bacterium 73-15]ROR97366.1 adenylate kinase [Salana multivorans]
MTRLLIMGPQGSGKGTQAARIAEALGIPAISTGDIFRANIKGDTELGRLARSYSDRGELVPDEVTNAMVRDRLAAQDTAAGFLLDGYPRNAAQVEELDAILAERGTPLQGVVALDVPRAELLERIAQRAVAEGRSDDTAEAIERRLAVYEEQTAPLLDAYRERGILLDVVGVGDVEEITTAILAGLGSRGIGAA